MAHVINLAAQQALNSLKAISNTNEEEFLDENENNDEQIIGETANLLHKVNYYFLYLLYFNIIKIIKINYFLASYSYLQNKSFTTTTRKVYCTMQGCRYF